MVLSLWRDNVCAASFRLEIEEVPELIELLRVGLQRAYRHAPPAAGLSATPTFVCGPAGETPLDGADESRAAREIYGIR